MDSGRLIEHSLARKLELEQEPVLTGEEEAEEAAGAEVEDS